MTLPSFLNAGFRVGILAMSDLPGCSSLAYSTSPLRVATLTGTISPSKAPAAWAAWARLTDSMAKLSWSSRLKPYLATVASANTPMAWPSYGLVRPSQAMWSTAWKLP